MEKNSILVTFEFEDNSEKVIRELFPREVLDQYCLEFGKRLKSYTLEAKEAGGKLGVIIVDDTKIIVKIE